MVQAHVTGPNLRLGMRAFRGSPPIDGGRAPEPIFEVAFEEGSEVPFALTCDPILTVKHVCSTEHVPESGPSWLRAFASFRRSSREQGPANVQVADAILIPGAPGERRRLRGWRNVSGEQTTGFPGGAGSGAGAHASPADIEAFLERRQFLEETTRWQPSQSQPPLLSLVPVLVRFMLPFFFVLSYF